VVCTAGLLADHDDEHGVDLEDLGDDHSAWVELSQHQYLILVVRCRKSRSAQRLGWLLAVGWLVSVVPHPPSCR
jgi:hypothetical protein